MGRKATFCEFGILLALEIWEIGKHIVTILGTARRFNTQNFKNTSDSLQIVLFIFKKANFKQINFSLENIAKKCIFCEHNVQLRSLG